MLVRPHDAPFDEQEWRDLIAAHPFGTLIAPGRDRDLPIVVPTHVHFDGDRELRFHLARPNPVWRALVENPRCLFVVTAAVAYSPTSWEAEPGTDPHWGIPTSHYATAQLDCTARFTDDEDEIRNTLADQLATMQPDEPYGDPRLPDAPYADRFAQIRGLELTINDVRAKFKFDGGDPDAVRRQVIAGYRLRGTPDDLEALQHLQRRHPVD